MTTLNDALALVRKAHPKDLIWYSFKYQDSWVFGYTRGKKYYPNDVSLAACEVSGNQCKEMFDFWAKIFTDEAFAKAWNTRKAIDVEGVI